jgi:hypothetical protein
MKNLRLLIVLMLLPLTSLASVTAAKVLAISSPAPTFTLLIHELKHKTHIPVLLPTPAALQTILGNNSLSMDDVAINKRHGYLIYFENTPGCFGGPICTQGSLFATKSGRRQAYNPNVNYPKLSSQNHYQVTLADNITGYMEKYTTAKYPKPRLFYSLSFKKDGCLYQLSLQQKPNANFIALANNIITGKAITPSPVNYLLVKAPPPQIH